MNIDTIKYSISVLRGMFSTAVSKHGVRGLARIVDVDKNIIQRLKDDVSNADLNALYRITVQYFDKK